jgi:hypothetical protein
MDGRGRAVASGVYQVMVELAGEVTRTSITLVR